MAAVDLNKLLSTFTFNGTLAPGKTFNTTNEQADINYIAGVDANYATVSRSFAKEQSNGVIDTFGAGSTISVGFYNSSEFTDAAKDNAFQALQLWSGLVGLNFVYSADAAKAQFVFTHTGDTYQKNVLGRGTLYSVGRVDPTSRSYVDISRNGYIQIDNVTKQLDSNGNVILDKDGDPFLSYGDIGSYTSGKGYGIDTLVHEVGHLVGLGHAGNYNNYVAASTQQFNEFDARTWSLMSYISPTGTVPNTNTKPTTNETPYYLSSYPVQVDWQGEAPYTPMGLDIIAAQRLVGPTSSSMFSGNNTFGFNSNIMYSALDGTKKKLSMYNFAPSTDGSTDTKPVVTLYDYGTNNTLDLSGFSDNSRVSLKDGSFSSVAGLTNNIFIEWGTQIDRTIGGAGDDTFVLNERGDYVDGGAGTNTAVFSGTRSQYVLGYAGNSDVELTKASSGETYRLHNIQSFQFSDGTSALGDLPRVAWVGSGAANGDHFGIAANWSNSQVPDIASQVRIGAGAAVVVTLQVTNEVDSLTLAPTASIDVTGHFVINNGASDSTNAGAITVESGGTLYFSGGLVNAGTLSVSGQVLTRSAIMSLAGGGTVLLNGVIGGQDANSVGTFINEDNIIEGDGTIGLSAGYTYSLNFLNGAAGRVIANSPLSMTIASVTVNNGQMIADGGMLVLRGSVDQSAGGTMTASGTRSKILFDGGSLTGGMLAATDGATIEVDADATFSNALTINGNVAVTTGATLKLVGDIYLDGTIDGTGGHLDLSGAHVHGGTVTGGSGGLTLVSSDGFFDGAGATVGNAAPIDIGPGRTLMVKGALSNSGIIKVDGSSVYGAATLLVSDVVTLTGGGSIVMLDSYGSNLSGTAAIIRGTIASEKLDNVDNTIQGYGVLGAGTLTFVNEAGGIVKATASTLTLDTGAIALSNLGLLAAQGGTLVIASVLTNGGNIYSGTGGTVTLKAAVTNTGNVQIAGGTLALSGGSLTGTGSLEVATKLETVTTGTIDGTSQTVHLFGDLVVDQGATLTLKGAIQNEGNAKLNASSVYGGATLLLAGKVTLSGGGTLTLLDTYGSNQSATAAVVRGTSATDILENAGNTIQGYGQLGAGTMTLINKVIGTIVATSSTLTVDTGAAVIANYGLLEAVGGTLAVNSAVANAGVILAGAGGHVVLHGAVTGAGSVKAVQGGTLVLAGGTIASTVAVSSAVDTMIEVASAAGLDGSQFAVSQAGTLGIDQGASLALAGTVANTGAMVLNGSSVYGAAALTVSGAVKLTGGGTLTLLDTYGSNKSTTAATVAGSSSSDSLENVDNTIRGYGQLGAGKLTLANDASGIINATDSTLVLRTSSMRNAGLLEAGGGTLVIETTIDNTGGQIVAAGSTVQLGGEGVAAIISGGVLSRSGTGGFVVTAAATLKDLTSLGPVQVSQGATLNLAGGIVDQGGILVDGSSVYGASTLRVSGPVSLSGGGTITLTDTYGSNMSGTAAAISGAAAGDALDNIDNVIQGYGQIGNNLAFTNEASGVVNAIASTLTLNTAAHHIINRGLIEATTGNLTISSATDNTGQILSRSGGTLTLNNVIFNNSTISVASGAKMVLDYSAIIGTGGTVVAAAGSTIEVSAASLLDAQRSSVNLNGDLGIDQGASLALAGTVANTGAMVLNGSSVYGAAALTVSGAVKLTGGGTLTLLDTYGSNKSTTAATVAGSSSSDSLDNVDNNITGYGELGQGKLSFTNEAAGTVSATAATLNLNFGATTTINRGTFLAAGGTLAVGSKVSNLGAVRATAGTAAFAAGAVANLVSGVLTGGAWSINGGTITLADAVTSVAATLIEDGATGGITAAGASLDSSLASITAAGALQLLGGRNWAGTNLLANAGEIRLAGGRFASGVLTNTGRIDGSGTIASSVVNSGTIEATGGALTLVAKAGGSLQIDAGATLVLQGGAGPGTTVSFAGVGGTLSIAPAAGASSFDLTLGLGIGNTVDLAGVLASATSKPGSITLSAGGQVLGIIRMAAGNAYTADATSDGHGGTLIATRLTDPLFDPVYYLAQNPDVAAAGADPYSHYMNQGWKEGRNPSALFNTHYYLAQNPDVAASGVNPLTQFETVGWTQGRDPSIGFSVAKYLAAYPDIKAAGVDPLVHYVNSGKAEGRTAFAATPHAVGPQDPLVDAAYVDAHNPAVAAAGLDPTVWFNTVGWTVGANPDAFFNTTYYLNQNADVKAAGINPLAHFEASGWKEGRDPSALFSDRRYLAAYPDIGAAGINPLQHYLSSGLAEGRMAFAATPHALGPQDPLVDAAYVYAAHPDVAAAGLDAAAWYHGTGWKVGANPDAYFDTSYYLTQNPDVRAAGLDPLAHFEANGWKEGREPSLVFSDARYLAAYPDIKAAGVDPLAHYLASGRLEGRMAFLAGGAMPVPDPLVNAAYFDAQFGATLIPAGAAGAQQAAFLYDAIGWQRGLNPDALFDTNYYLSRNPDIAAAHINPLLHYENNGWKEGRNPSAQFSTNKYLAAYGDVKAAGLDPLLHFVSNGQSEGRSAFTV